jgi:hypothetical protein
MEALIRSSPEAFEAADIRSESNSIFHGRTTSGWVLTDKGYRMVSTMNKHSLSEAVLYTKSTPRVFPLNGLVDTGDLAGAAFQTAGEFDGHLSLLGERIEVGRAGIDAEPFSAFMADLLVEGDMRFFVVFESIDRKLFSNLHRD